MFAEKDTSLNSGENIKNETVHGSQKSDNNNSQIKQEDTSKSAIPNDSNSSSSIDSNTKNSSLSKTSNDHSVISKDSMMNNNKDSDDNSQSIDKINNPEFKFFDQTIPKSQIFSLDTDLITTKMKDSEVVNHDMIASSKSSTSGNTNVDPTTSSNINNNGNSDDLKRKTKKRKIALRKDNWKIFSQTVNHLTRSLIHGIVEDELNHDFDKYFKELKDKAANSPYVINVFGNHTESEAIKRNITPEEHKGLSIDKLSLWNEVLNWLPILDEEKSTIVVNYAIDNLFFLRNLFDPVTFKEEHKLFWSSKATEKHITLKYDRETDEYLWTGLWYAILTAGFHYCDEDLQKALGFEEMFMNNFAQIFLCCALECVVRGRYMTFPNPRSIQVIQVLSLTCYAFGGDNLQKCSFHSAIYIARKLNFHKVSNNVKNNKILKNIWWNLVSTDWLNSYGRYSFILPNTFVTGLPDDFKLKDPANNNVEVFDVSTYYINVLNY
ncbi:unnamed protein product [[Candida] boidinii]|nr:unnamed protein product [[Candida] boidinii]